MTDNPLLLDDFHIPFDRIRAEDVTPGVRQALAEAQADLDGLCAEPAEPTWSNTLERLERITETLSRRTSPVGHLVSVAETPELRDAYNAVLPEISAFWSRLPLNEALWRRLKAFADTEEAATLTGIRRRHLEKTLEEFRRAGADLPAEPKKRLEEVRVELARLQQKFSENVLDATAAYELHVEDESRLEGVPDAARRRARVKAEERGLKGVLLTLDYPSVEPILKYCDDRDLRREIQVAYATRCRNGEHDNRPLMGRILALRHELATLLGFEDFPDYRLADRMAKTGARAVDFEVDLRERTRTYWERDVREMEAFAAARGMRPMEPWDASYVMEKLRKERYDVDDEMLRPYFPLDRVLEGMFEIVRRSFGFTISEAEVHEAWHPDVRYYEIRDAADVLVGAFYTDFFPRKEKRQGAWMNHFITGGPRDGGFSPHLGVICGNFTPPEDGRPALLTHREVETTFHEFGHLLHHCTSRVPVASRAGINVAWDWVELPSQLMENWAWEREALDLFARHHETGEPVPDDLFRRLVAARRFMGGWMQMRQISFGTVDLALHRELAPELARQPDGDGERTMAFARALFAEFAPSPRFADLHILASFTHLFAGGYAAGYYSYLWSEVLDADVFTRFREEGIFNPDTGGAYVDGILTRGDSAEPEELFRDFMGRDPDPTALLERNLGHTPS